MKKYFMIGFIILLPTLLTLVIMQFLVNFFTDPFLEPVQKILGQFQNFQDSFLFSIVPFLLRVLILITLFIFIILIGWLAEFIVGEAVFKIGDYILHRIPYINRIYKMSQEIVGAMFSSSLASFSQVVLVPFPNSSRLAIGLLPKGSPSINDSENDSNNTIRIFVPTSPNPSAGFILNFKKEEILYVKMSVEEAIKVMVSCGTIMPNSFIKAPGTTE